MGELYAKAVPCAFQPLLPGAPSACVLALYASSAFAQDPFVSEVQHFDYDAKPALDK